MLSPGKDECNAGLMQIRINFYLINLLVKYRETSRIKRKCVEKNRRKIESVDGCWVELLGRGTSLLSKYFNSVQKRVRDF